MNLIIRIIHCLFWNGTPAEKTKPPAKNASQPDAKKLFLAPPGSFTNDDSPPGNKIRWHL